MALAYSGTLSGCAWVLIFWAILSIAGLSIAGLSIAGLSSFVNNPNLVSSSLTRSLTTSVEITERRAWSQKGFFLHFPSGQ
ncbi:hypothetical protein [Moellerella wisconsensis]|uniref:hypothetical protein n=1 Tax=Moellerella wisconsensis TaxID=158849 RepID=UPI001F4D5D44|nr:hypothetical protein [Moellerella wisconsensis]UNH23511.1 hypothetical protein MNY68_11895 [Moellerella wisconsensis]